MASKSYQHRRPFSHSFSRQYKQAFSLEHYFQEIDTL